MNKKGLTFAELLVAVFVLSIGILSVLLFYTNSMRAVDYAQDLTIATIHGEYVLEEMQTRNTLANITATDWTAWAIAEGLDSLNNETIAVAIENATADPLHIDATVSWTKNLRDYNIVFTTELTK